MYCLLVLVSNNLPCGRVGIAAGEASDGADDKAECV